MYGIEKKERNQNMGLNYPDFYPPAGDDNLQGRQNHTRRSAGGNFQHPYGLTIRIERRAS